MELLYWHIKVKMQLHFIWQQSFSLKLKRKATAVEKRTEHNTIPRRASGTSLTLCISLNILISLFMMSRLSSSRSISSKPCKSKKKKKNELIKNVSKVKWSSKGMQISINLSEQLYIFNTLESVPQFMLRIRQCYGCLAFPKKGTHIFYQE